MADVFSILSTAYKTAPTPSAASSAKYVPVDPKLYEGTWKGTYSTGEKFSFTISNVEGFRAKVKYQSGNGPIKYQDVLIKDNSFRLGDSKFLLKKVGHATIKTVVTNPATGRSALNTASADLQT
jgi:hypothetical protein